MLLVCLTGTAFATDYHVNPDDTKASDSYDGKAAVWESGTRGPKLTLAGVMAVATASGDIVHAARGHYNSGTMAISGHKTLNRVVIPAGVTLVATEGKDVTFIEGEAAPEGNRTGIYGNGTNAVRCAYLKLNSKLRDFTLCGGHVYAAADNDANSEQGAAVYCAGTWDNLKRLTPIITDCMISNNVGCTYAVTYYGTFYRCKFFNNRTTCWAGVSMGAYYNCIVDHSIGGTYAVYRPCPFVNGTIGSNCTSYCATGSDSDANRRFYNSIILGNYWKITAHNCLLAGVNIGSTIMTNGTRTVTSAQLDLDADYRPSTNSIAIDAGTNGFYTAEYDVDANYWATEGLTDSDKNPRFMNGLIDIGAYELDRREDFAKDLAPERVAVTAASSNVTETADNKVALGPQAELDITWISPTGEATEYSFQTLVSGTGTLKCYVNSSETPSVEVTAAAGNTNLILVVSGASVRFFFCYEGDDGQAILCNFSDQNYVRIDPGEGGLSLSGVSFGETTVADGDTLTFTITRTFDTAHCCIGFTLMTLGGSAFLSFDDYPDGWTHTVSSRESSVHIVPVYAEHQDFYVDAKDGDDNNCGFLPTLAMKTLAGVFSKPGLITGDTVYLKPGIYDQGTMRDGSEKTLNRAIVKRGVNLVGLGAAENVIIMGGEAPTEKQVENAYGCGEDAVRCLRLLGTNIVRNVTLCGGRIYVASIEKITANADSCGKYAAANCSGESNYLIGCTITNCVGFTMAVFGDTDKKGNASLIRCHVCGNRAMWYALMQDVNLYNCAVYGNSGAYSAHNCFKILNCTIMDTSSALRDTYSTETRCRVYNSIINSSQDSKTVMFNRCFFPNSASSYQNIDQCLYLLDGCKTNGLSIIFKPGTYTPKNRSCSAVNAGENAYLTNFPAAFPQERELDLYGNRRIWEDIIDVGAGEFSDAGIVLLLH